MLVIPAAAERNQSAPAPSYVVTPLVYRPVILTVPVRRQIKVTPRRSFVPKPALIEPRQLVEPRQLAKRSPLPVPESPRLPTATLQVPEPALIAEAPLAPSRLEVPALPTRPTVAAPVKTGVFGGAGDAAAVHVPTPRAVVNTGGFGAANVGRGQPPAARSGQVQMGVFGSPTGAGENASRFGTEHPVAVAEAGFGKARADTSPRHVESGPSETPVEVLWKPKPRYTQDARAKKLEGDVVLSVIFCASGEVHVVRVVRGLGSGLDESARVAAGQIRFRPGKKDGVPVDRAGMVQITFELS